MDRDKTDEWICKICGRKIWWWIPILSAWYQTDEGKVHRWCHGKPKNKDRPLNLKFA